MDSLRNSAKTIKYFEWETSQPSGLGFPRLVPECQSTSLPQGLPESRKFRTGQQRVASWDNLQQLTHSWFSQVIKDILGKRKATPLHNSRQSEVCCESKQIIT
ncbi:hypothetical protein TNIN_26341 [Trichonephila inaurata madagascariensis]|uniref:Uncharacterized protein n=1 Tax=Trichonephila inaurata madagascariensis TaxID=2747483 RepID=A0A8X6I717_9ARAC|nr:hypothetical protein TNIN_26341 [Trichonephila inaurata madagascariensis]